MRFISEFFLASIACQPDLEIQDVDMFKPIQNQIHGSCLTVDSLCLLFSFGH